RQGIRHRGGGRARIDPGKHPRCADARLFRNHRRLSRLDVVDRDRFGRRHAADARRSPGGILRAARRLLSTMRTQPPDKRLELTGAAMFIAVMAVLPLVFNSRYLIGVLTVSAIYGFWAVSWDFMSGLTR